MRIRVTGLHREAMRHALLEADRKAVVSPRTPRSKTLNAFRTSAWDKFVCEARHTRFERKIRGANGRDVFDVFMVVVQRPNHVVPDLALQTDVVVECVRDFETGIHADGDLPRSS